MGGRSPHGTSHSASGAPLSALPGIAVSIALLVSIVPSAQEPALAIATRARATAPGEVVRLDVRSGIDLERLGVSVPWHPVIAFRTGPREWHALVGIDLDVLPGER